MCFNHIPVNTLNQQQQQILVDLENTPISLIGNGDENIIVNMNNIHNNFVNSVIIESDTVSQFSEEYWNALRNRLIAYQCEIQSLNDAQANINEDYNNTLSQINSIITELDNGTLQNSLTNELLLGSYCPSDKNIHLYLNTITNYANSHNYNPDNVLAYIYIREMFHAFYHQMAGGNGCHYIREIEEPMAVCGMLCYLKNASEKTQRPDFANIYQIAKDNAETMKSCHLAALGYGLFVHVDIVEKANKEVDPQKSQKEYDFLLRLLGEYAQKSKLIDHLSYNVIKYAVELIQGYPAPSPMSHEGERLLFNLLIHQTLNVGQHQELSFVHLYEQMKTELKKSLLEQWQPKGTKFDPNYQSQL